MLLLAGTAHALTIRVIGADGAMGLPGVDGEAGEPADAIAISADPSNGATATSGRGGDGGAGADGGPGGDASARAETSTAGAASALAAARARRGGGGVAGGAGGSAASFAAASGEAEALAEVDAAGGSGGGGSAVGGRGGDASGRATAEASAGNATAGSRFAVAGGNGGSGGEAAGEGGAAVCEVRASASDDASAAAEARGGAGGSAPFVAPGPRAPGPGADGGVARADAVALGGRSATALAAALGGQGGAASGAAQQAGAGASASAAAFASGAEGAEARALARGGAGGRGENGATPGRGGDARLAGAVAGADPVALVLGQHAEGGDGGDSATWDPSRGCCFVSGTGARGGDASATGDFENPAGGDLFVALSASGGGGGSGSTRGDGGGAHVGGSATSAGAGDVTLAATAQTGSGYREGALAVDPLVAIASGSGNARVELDARLGDAWGDPYGRTPAAPLSLVDRVDAVASSSAEIALRQSAASSGGAESVLDVSKSAALLDLEANAEGGEARIFVRGRNDAGGLRLSGEARGAASFEPLAQRDGTAVFEATTSGDGHDIEIGSASRPARAVGGSESSSAGAGAGRVDARGTALGDSAVRIDVVALGGDGTDSVGGDAFASATGEAAGDQLVDVLATAIGNEGYYGPGGDARADAFASGSGEARARAVARGGISSAPADSLQGSALARAEARGASGGAEAIASNARLFPGWQADDEQVGRVEVALTADVRGDAAVGASAGFTEFVEESLDASLDASLRAAFTPGAALLDAALAGNPRALAAYHPQPRNLAALVELRATSGGGAPQAFHADITLGDPYGGFDEYDPKPEAILVSFLDPELDAAAFGSLTLRSWDVRDPAEVYEVVFTSALEALAFLDDGRLVFGGLPRERHLEIVLETTGVAGGFFLDLVVAAVPEPSLLVLLAAAAPCALRRRRTLRAPAA